MAQCWNYITVEHCKSCIQAACQEIRSRCPHKQEAVVWYEVCFLKYYTVPFLELRDTTNGIYVTSPVFFDVNPLLFQQKVHKLLTELCIVASRSRKRFAEGRARYTFRWLIRIDLDVLMRLNALLISQATFVRSVLNQQWKNF